MSSEQFEAYLNSAVGKHKNALLSRLNTLDSECEKFKVVLKEKFFGIFSALEKGEKTFQPDKPLFEDELEIIRSKYNLGWIKQEKGTWDRHEDDFVFVPYSLGNRDSASERTVQEDQYLIPECDLLTFGSPKNETITKLETELKNLEATPKTVYEPIENVIDQHLENERQKLQFELDSRIERMKKSLRDIVENTLSELKYGEDWSGKVVDTGPTLLLDLDFIQKLGKVLYMRRDTSRLRFGETREGRIEHLEGGIKVEFYFSFLTSI